ncbi:MAG: flagellar protein FlaG [Succinivibrionaceae bacterium]|nr:flagellar protein FlaG [Succinivibrionaceae bacterium]MDD6546511.1 flagellar protein FlaG [Pseudomonadota bacterium]MDY6274752.1 flagellar protein FlaG [Succinivibrionaceae bacterium]MDY6337054.1 flagellar protein FlaG [Succinivibrionaceae bacterium]MDY6376549.1 flagellar protein FlaG [Succinivibrionaceae bacterium]
MNVSRMAGLGGVSSAAMNKPHSAKDPDGRRIQNDTELQQRAAQTDRSQNRVPRGIDSVGKDDRIYSKADGSDKTEAAQKNGRPEDAEEEKKETEALNEELTKFSQLKDVSLDFAIDKDSGVNVITVTERSTGDVIRQIPNEEFIEMKKRIDEILKEGGAEEEAGSMIKGLLVDRKV